MSAARRVGDQSLKVINTLLFGEEGDGVSHGELVPVAQCEEFDLCLGETVRATIGTHPLLLSLAVNGREVALKLSEVVLGHGRHTRGRADIFSPGYLADYGPRTTLRPAPYTR